MLLAYHPVARVNPYQALLYGHAWRHGVAPIPVPDLDVLDDLSAVASSGRTQLVLHLHWTHEVLRRARTGDEARAALTAFLARIDRFVAGGGRLIWTVHNTTPHELARPELDVELQQGIVDRAHLVHVMSTNSPALVAPWFTIPEAKVAHVPHQRRRRLCGLCNS